MRMEYEFVMIGDVHGDMDVERVTVEASSYNEAERNAIAAAKRQNPSGRGWYVEKLVRQGTITGQAKYMGKRKSSRKSSSSRKGARYCRICKGPHVYKHGR